MLGIGRQMASAGPAESLTESQDWMFFMWDSVAETGAIRLGRAVCIGLTLPALLGVAACTRPRDALPGGLSLRHEYTQIEPAGSAVSDLAAAAAGYQTRRAGATGAELDDLTLKDCLELAVNHNRGLRRATHAAERIGLGRELAWRQLTQPFLNASYQVQEGSGTYAGAGSISGTGRWAGFEVEPFVNFAHDQTADDDLTGSYGVAVSRQLFRLDTERVRQYLPLTDATRDFHLALNNRVLELRRLHLAVVQAFYDIQRLSLRVAVRVKREADARQFLERTHTNVVNGMSAPGEETNAQISLNQAQADLVGERANLQNARESLLDLLGVDLSRPLSIRADDLTSIRHARIDLSADVALALAHHERVRNLLLTMEARRLEYRVDLDALRPDLSATLTASRDTDGLDDNGEVSATVDLSVPLDGYRAERARATQDRLRLMELALELAALRSELEKELRRRWRTIDQLKTTVSLAEERLESERRKLETTSKRYEIEGLDNLEVVRAKEAVDNAELTLLETRIARILEEARYRAQLPATPRPEPAPAQPTPNGNAAEDADTPAAEHEPDP